MSVLGWDDVVYDDGIEGISLGSSRMRMVRNHTDDHAVADFGMEYYDYDDVDDRKGILRRLLDFDHLKWTGRALGILYALWIVAKVGGKKKERTNSASAAAATTTITRSTTGISTAEQRPQQERGQPSSSSEVAAGDSFLSATLPPPSSSSRTSDVFLAVYYFHANLILFIMIFCFDEDEFAAIIMTISASCEFGSTFWNCVTEGQRSRQRRRPHRRRRRQEQQQQPHGQSTGINETTHLIRNTNDSDANTNTSTTTGTSEPQATSAFQKKQRNRILRTICCTASAYFLWIVVLGPLEHPDVT